MCQFASLIVTKDKVLWSKHTDSHTDICKEHDIHEDGTHGLILLTVEQQVADARRVVASLAKWAAERETVGIVTR